MSTLRGCRPPGAQTGGWVIRIVPAVTPDRPPPHALRCSAPDSATAMQPLVLARLGGQPAGPDLRCSVIVPNGSISSFPALRGISSGRTLEASADFFPIGRILWMAHRRVSYQEGAFGPPRAHRRADPARPGRGQRSVAGPARTMAMGPLCSRALNLAPISDARCGDARQDDPPAP